MLRLLSALGSHVFFALSFVLVQMYTLWRAFFMHVLPHNAAQYTHDIGEQALPGDVILTRSEGAIVPGFWSHSAICVGDVPGLGQAAIEARGWGVKVVPLRDVMQTHYAVLLRPKLDEAAAVAAAKEARGLVGRGFDFNFGFKDHMRLSCSEVPYVLYRKHLPLKLRPWQHIIDDWDVFLPDDVYKSGHFSLVWHSPDMPKKQLERMRAKTA